MVPKCQLLESENFVIPVCAAIAALCATSSSSDHVLFFFEHFALFFADFADFFLISAMLKIPIIPRSVASPVPGGEKINHLTV